MKNGVSKTLTMVEESLDEDRPNRLCVTVSDLHFTDGSVGCQNLDEFAWNSLYSSIAARCKNYHIKELTFVMDGDVVDMIRTSKWAEKGVYPWQRDHVEFPNIVFSIVKDIVDNKHKDFFLWLKALPQKIKVDVGVETVNTVITLGNHDKELFCDNRSLAYLYEQGLGRKLEDIPEQERRQLGEMYGDETMFLDKTIAPYFPFYYGDRGFRFFTTHGQWRDGTNSRRVKAAKGLPGWKESQGWQPEIWQQLKYSPFILPCFGDTVAAGVLSTFIYLAKDRLKDVKDVDPKIYRVLDELDLYRPTHKALTRLLGLTRNIQKEKSGSEAARVIEDTLYECVMQWLDWKITYQTSPLLRSAGLKGAKWLLKAMHLIGFHLEIKTMNSLMNLLSLADRWLAYGKDEMSYKELKGLPAFLPDYQKYAFQIHGEGHTHKALQEELNVGYDYNSTYINFGTWRDQIICRKKAGYRRRGVLRAVYILDLQDLTDSALGKRSFDYSTHDIIAWGDKADAMDRSATFQTHI